MRKTVMLLMAGAAVLFSACDEVELPEAAHDRGGTSFDLAKMSAEIDFK